MADKLIIYVSQLQAPFDKQDAHYYDLKDNIW